MPTMNWFGCTTDLLLSRFATGSYAPTIAELGGADAVDAALNSAEDQVIQALPEEVFLQLTRIELQYLTMRATANQATVTTSFAPILAGQTYVWKGQPSYFKEKPRKSTDLLSDDEFFDSSTYRPLTDLVLGTDFTIDNSTGVITFTAGHLLAANDMVAVSYEPDIADEDYSVPSLAQCIADGAAYLRACVLYPRSSSQWEYLNVLQEQFSKKLEALQDKTWIPPELRLMNFWKEVVPVTDDNSKIKVGRLTRG